MDTTHPAINNPPQVTSSLLKAIVLIAGSAICLAYPLATPLIASVAALAAYRTYRATGSKAMQSATIICATTALIAIGLDLFLLQATNTIDVGTPTLFGD